MQEFSHRYLKYVQGNNGSFNSEIQMQVQKLSELEVKRNFNSITAYMTEQANSIAGHLLEEINLEQNSEENEISSLDYLIVEFQDNVSKLKYSTQQKKFYCANCKKQVTNNQINRCSTCKNVQQCNKDCQKNHWLDHKKDCQKRNDNVESVSPAKNSMDDDL